MSETNKFFGVFFAPNAKDTPKKATVEATTKPARSISNGYVAIVPATISKVLKSVFSMVSPNSVPSGWPRFPRSI